MLRPFVAIALCCFLCSCVNRRTVVENPVMPKQPVAESSAQAEYLRRGRSAAYIPPVTIAGVQRLDEALYARVRAEVLAPLERGSYRYVIDSVMLHADGIEGSGWTLGIALDTGALVKVEEFADFSRADRSPFARGMARTDAALEQARRADAALDRYIRFLERRQSRR